MLRDEHELSSYKHDFGRIKESSPATIFIPQNNKQLQQIINYANTHQLPLTIRGNGLSQSGQSLPIEQGASVHMKYFNKVHAVNDQAIWIDANASWADLLNVSIPQNLTPYVTPFNCNLTIAGVLSAGGVGASSFRYGNATAHVDALEIVTAAGEIVQVDSHSTLFQACLGGQGCFGVITKARIKLRPCKKNVRTFFLSYLDKEQWMIDMETFKQSVDYIEAFCSPALQGAKLAGDKRQVFAEWLFALQVTVEFDETLPDLFALNHNAQPWKVLHVQEESVITYLHRHDSRFIAMQVTGQWEQYHPWYECFINKAVLAKNLDSLLNTLPLYYATTLQVLPVDSTHQQGFCMLPAGNDIYSLMILNAGVPQALVPGCLAAIQALDAQFLKQGGKRYLSGFLGENLTSDYWQHHFGSRYEEWISLKKQYNPNQIFCSLLHPL